MRSDKFVPKPPYNRTREKSYTASFSGHFRSQTTDKASGVTTIHGEFDRISLKKCKVVMTDVVTPGFEFIQAGGGIVNSPMTQEFTSYEVSDSGFEARYENSYRVSIFTETKANPFYFGWPGHLPHSINVENLKNYVSVKALAGMKPSSMQGIVALAEGGKTLAMLLNPLSSFSTLLKYVIQQRQGRRNLTIANVGNSIVINGKRFPGHNRLGVHQGPGRYVTPPKHSIVIPAGQAISGGVLANNLGLRPLLMDLEALLKGIPQLHQEPRLTSRSSLSDETSSATTSRVANGQVSAERTVTTKTKVTVRASVLYEDKFDVLQDFGVSLLDIPSAAWELIPFSFLLDYIINIGDLLAANQMLMTRKILMSSLVVTTDIVTTAAYSKLLVSGMTVTKDLSATSVETSKVKQRIPYLNNPMIAYRPSSKILRPTVIQNVLSLIVQQLTHLGKSSKTPFF